MTDRCDCCDSAAANGGQWGIFRTGCDTCKARWITQLPPHAKAAQVAQTGKAEADRLREVFARWRRTVL